MKLFSFASSRKDNLGKVWKSGKPIKNTCNVRYIGDSIQPAVVKSLRTYKDFRRHISFHRKVVCQKIKTPQMLSKDPKNLMIKYQAVGIKYDGEKVWSKTLVNFEYNPNKEAAIIDFLFRTIDYALKNQWSDLHSGNILFDDGYLYLIDYVPGSGKHEVGSFGLQKINMEQKSNLVKERFDCLLEMALDKFPEGKVSYSGLDFIRFTDLS